MLPSWIRDVEMDGIPVSPYCSLPDQIDVWLRAFDKSRRMCGAPGTQKRIPPEKEIRYLDSLVRGVYARHPLQAGQKLTPDDIYLAIPLLKGQLSCRELMHGEVLTQDCVPHQAVMIGMIDGPHARNKGLRDLIYRRGLDPKQIATPVPDTATSLIAMSGAITEIEVEKPAAEWQGVAE